MRGNLIERRPGYWQLRIYTGVDPVTGKKREKSEGFSGNKRAAEKALRDFIARYEDGQVVADTKGTVGHLMSKYLELCETRGRSPTTMVGYRSIAAAIRKELGEVPLDDLDAERIDTYYAKLVDGGMSPARLRHYHRFLSSCLNQAVKWGWLLRNPAKNASPPSVVRKAINMPETEDVARLLAAAREAELEELATAFWLLSALGVRRGELCGLRWADLDGRTLTVRRSVTDVGGRLTVKGTKTNREREVTVDYPTLRLLVDHRRGMRNAAEAAGVGLDPSSYILANQDLDLRGQIPWRPARLTLALSRLRERAGYTGRLHDLRHGNISGMLLDGVDVVTAATRAGHSTAVALEVYGHSTRTSERAAAATIGRRTAGLAAKKR